MSNHLTKKEIADDVWYWYLIGKHKTPIPRAFELQLRTFQTAQGLLPGSPRCIQCNAPLAGLGAHVARRMFGTRPSVLTPRLCNSCENFMLESEAGAEVELTMLFADIRGSTSMSEQKAAMEYKEFIQRFYKTAAKVLIEHNALVNRLMGDQVIGLFVPRFAGSDHSAVAIESAVEILRATGHTDPQGPWVSVGVGVHTAMAYVGAVGSKEGVNEIAVLGNAANLTARLSSKAAGGEVLISEQAANSAKSTLPRLKQRRLKLRGFTKTISVQVMKVNARSLASAPGSAGKE
jgi:adenylate cyclase